MTVLSRYQLHRLSHAIRVERQLTRATQARSRSERLFQTLQDRVPNELALERLGGELVPRTRGQTDDVVAARAINPEPWEPMPSIERRCPDRRS
jgi:hypothetical protein